MIALRPNDEVHFVALLDASGETLGTVPLSSPLVIPKHGGSLKSVDVKVDLQVELHGWAR